MEAAPTEFTIPPTDPEDMAVLHFTSGTTGMPKGAVHVHNAVLHHYMTSKYALDLHPNDIFWCTADPGWVTGTSYGIIAPLLHGVTNIVDEADFDADRWYRILEEQQVNVWYTASTAIRRLMRMQIEPRKEYNLDHLRFMASVGEPLNPEAVVWGREVLDINIHDNWWQTETGGIMIANFASMEIRPDLWAVRCRGAGRHRASPHARHRRSDHPTRRRRRPGAQARLAVHVPLLPPRRRTLRQMLRRRLVHHRRPGHARRGRLLLVRGPRRRHHQDSGPHGRSVRGGKRAHGTPRRGRSCVIGVPEPTIGELVKAFVSLKPGYEPSDELRLALIGFGRKHLGSAVAPKDIAFEQNLPKTRSGKIMRRLLKARELGLPEGDTSTLEKD
ncbi:MAG: AMP-binding protein [Caldilineaceae bacterium]